jgi:choline dehydrogenase-like flavoprotein
MAAMPGMTLAEDSGAGQNGLYWYSLSQDPVNYQRSYARTGHWDGIGEERDNYEMIISSKVNKVILDDDLNATGVQFTSLTDPESEAVTVSARREVILAAGTIHTPQILMLSGVGPSDHLEDAGIDAKVDLAGVGSNFQDHSYIPSISYRCKSVCSNQKLEY